MVGAFKSFIFGGVGAFVPLYITSWADLPRYPGHREHLVNIIRIHINLKMVNALEKHYLEPI